MTSVNVLFYVAVPPDLIHAAILIPNGVELVERASPYRLIYPFVLGAIMETFRLMVAVLLVERDG
jgi:hypothetical protein